MLLYVALAATVAAVALFALTSAGVFAEWWNRKTQAYAAWMVVEFDSMFRDMTVERASRLVTGATVSGIVAGLVLGDGLAGRAIAMSLLGLAGYFGPSLFVRYLRYRRLEAVDGQLVDTLILMSNGLKAGLSLQQALELVVREMSQPISDEFGRVIKEIHLGRLTDDALRRLRERVPLEDVGIAVEAILTLRETGGNLSETFQVIAQTITERKKVQGKIKSMTAQGMSQGVLVCMMPPGMLLIFSIIDSSFIAPLFTTALGLIMLVVVALLDVVGLWLMFQLVKVDV